MRRRSLGDQDPATDRPTSHLHSGSPPYSPKPDTPASLPTRAMLSPAPLVAREQPHSTPRPYRARADLISAATLLSFRRERAPSGFRCGEEVPPPTQQRNRAGRARGGEAVARRVGRRESAAGGRCCWVPGRGEWGGAGAGPGRAAPGPPGPRELAPSSRKARLFPVGLPRVSFSLRPPFVCAAADLNSHGASRVSVCRRGLPARAQKRLVTPDCCCRKPSRGRPCVLHSSQLD